MRLSCRFLTGLISVALLGGGAAVSQLTPVVRESNYEHLKSVTTSLDDQAIIRGDDYKFLLQHGAKSNYKDKTIYVDQNFTSNLPLIVIDTGSEHPEETTKWDHDEQRFIEVPDAVKYVEGSFSLINNDSGLNSINDEPEKSSSMKIRMRGNSSMHFDKHQYQVKLLHEDGTKNKMNLLGMGKESDWILNISMIDSSLMRNKLAYELGKELFPYTSDSEYCEVIWKDGDTYSYEGVYMLIEPVEAGENRVQIAEQRANLPFTPALMRRDRLDDTGLFLNNTASWDNTMYGFIEVLYPPAEELSEKSIARLNQQIEDFENALLSDDPDTFFQYREMINMTSFLDYYLINEFFGNYDAGNNSTYFYIDQNGKITMGPVWDFDGAMDNWYRQEASVEYTAMESTPWFEQLFRDKEFIRLLDQRFQELRSGILSDESIDNALDIYTEELGPAIDRDWSRYGYYYSSDRFHQVNNLDENRNVQTHAQEVERIKKNLKDHGDWMTENLKNLVFKSDPSFDRPYEENTWATLVKYDFLPILFVGAFLISIILVQRG